MLESGFDREVSKSPQEWMWWLSMLFEGFVLYSVVLVSLRPLPTSREGTDFENNDYHNFLDQHLKVTDRDESG